MPKPARRAEALQRDGDRQDGVIVGRTQEPATHSATAGAVVRAMQVEYGHAVGAAGSGNVVSQGAASPEVEAPC